MAIAVWINERSSIIPEHYAQCLWGFIFLYIIVPLLNLSLLTAIFSCLTKSVQKASPI